MKKAWAALRISLCLALVPLVAFAQVNPREYQVKAAFIYNFVKFIEWPGDLAIAKQNAINICVIGNDPFGEAGRQIFTRASTPALKLNLVVKKNGSVSGCHIAFISRSEDSRLADVLAGINHAPVLTVSDIDDFAARGGMIGFTSDDNKIKLVVNTANAGKAGLRVDAQLLEIAMQVIRE